MNMEELRGLFDGYLKSEGIVGDRNYLVVHDWMDNYCLQKDDVLINFEVNSVRDWILKESKSSDDVLLTDYIRVALGHLLLNLFSYNFIFKDNYQCMKRVIEFYLSKGYHSYTIGLGLTQIM
jgi:hypothetical protein